MIFHLVLVVLWVVLGLAYIFSGEPASPIFTGALCLLLALHNFTEYLRTRQ